MKIKELAKQAIIAAVYVAVSMVFQFANFSLIQFRVAEMLMPLAFYDRKNTYGLTIGCFLVNIFSPIAVYDMIFGTLATLAVCLIISSLKNRYFVPVVAGVINGIIVALMWYVMSKFAFLPGFFSIAIEEFAVVLCGVLVFKQIENKAWFPWKLRVVDLNKN